MIAEGKPSAEILDDLSAESLSIKKSIDKDDNDYMMAKSRKAFRRAALRRSKTARLFCHILLAMNIAQMIQRIICGKTGRFAARTIESSIVLAIR